ncbi:Reverse transcriptase (RNA-dependent DNA polymerase) [Popillia japonica]|uniref:Reverse transcriptase (RNA-dependent DNA polymerase) n=1 Tax=Popillia japonica TaxID=7064 RepID=A0AAW1K375_POPJA
MAETDLSERIVQRVFSQLQIRFLPGESEKKRTEYSSNGVSKKVYKYKRGTCRRSPSSAINFEIPIIRFGMSLDLHKIKIFGAKAWMVNIPRGGKMEERAKEVRMVGMEERAKEVRMVGYAKPGYKLYDPITDTVVTSRDVRFDETDIRYTEMDTEPKIRYTEMDTEPKTMRYIHFDNENDENENTRITERQHTPNENEGNENKTADEIQTEVTRSKGQIKLPENLLDYELYQAYYLTTMEEEEPQTYQEAIRKGWKDAIDKELEAHEIMRTWTVSDIPENTKIIDAKWIFKLKENGVRKARLVARGYQLKDDLFTNNYAPVARISTSAYWIQVTEEIAGSLAFNRPLTESQCSNEVPLTYNFSNIRNMEWTNGDLVEQEKHFPVGDYSAFVELSACDP